MPPDETRLQFGPEPLQAPIKSEAETIVPRAVRCPTCGQHFSFDARFCPFDGTKLVEAPNWDPSADPLIGTIVDKRYEVQAVLGEGGMGTVYRVRHVALGRQLAIKALRRDLARDKELGSRFIQEAKAAAAVAHPAIVQITDFGELPGGRPYFVMELLGGHSLAWLLKRGGPLPAARAVRILRTVAEALGAAHDAGIVHRDLKPDNIHVSEAVGERDVVKVLDFGLAKVAGASKLTRAGMVFGTPHYMSPEQAAGDPVDHRTDIYSLGVVMYEMFTGRVPFEADSYMGVLTKHMYVAPTPPSQVLSDQKHLGALEDITMRCLEKKPEKRFQRMSELLDELDKIVHFNDDGDIDVRPSLAGRTGGVRSVLADDLEAPSPEEVRLALSRAGIHPLLPRYVALAVGGAVLIVVLVLSALILSGSKPRPIPSASAVAAVAPPPPAPTPHPAAPPPEPEAAPVASTKIARNQASRPPGARTTTATRQSSPFSAPWPAQKPRSTAAPKKKTPVRTVVGAGEIVDPWAE